MGKYMRNSKGIEKMQDVSHCCHSHGQGSSLGVRTRARTALAALHEKENAIAHAIATNASATTPTSSPADSFASHHRHHHALRADKNSTAIVSNAIDSASSPHKDDRQNQPCFHRMELRSCRKLRHQRGSSPAIRPKCMRSHGDFVVTDLSHEGAVLDVPKVQHGTKHTNIHGSDNCSYDDSTSIEASATEVCHRRSSRVLRQMRSCSANSAVVFLSNGRASGQKQKLDLSIHIPPNLCCSTSIQPSHEKINNIISDHFSVTNPSPSPSPSLQYSAVSSPERKLDNARRPLGVLTRYQRQVLSSNIAGQEEADDQAATINLIGARHLHGDQNGLTSGQSHQMESVPCCGESPLVACVQPTGAITRPRRHAMNSIQTRGRQKSTAENLNSVQNTSDREEEYSCSKAPCAMEPCIPEDPGSTSKTPHKNKTRINSSSSSPSPVSSACFAVNNNDHNNNNARPRSAPPFSRTSNSTYYNAREYPSSGEIEAFLASAEQQQRRRFMDRYNFDPLREKALRGRYEWQKLIH